MVWMNIDKSSKKCTIYSDSDYLYFKNMNGTKYKGVGELKRGGDWLHFENIREANEYYLLKYDRYTLIDQCISSGNNNYITNKESKETINYINNESSFNSATDHYKRIMGFSPKKVNLNSLPKWIRIFYCIIIIIILVGIVLLIFSVIFNN